MAEGHGCRVKPGMTEEGPPLCISGVIAAPSVVIAAPCFVIAALCFVIAALCFVIAASEPQSMVPGSSPG